MSTTIATTLTVRCDNCGGEISPAGLRACSPTNHVDFVTPKNPVAVTWRDLHVQITLGQGEYEQKGPADLCRTCAISLLRGAVLQVAEARETA